jgi:hypothetical protein
MWNKKLNPDALEDLYAVAHNALGAYEALKMFGDEKYLPGYESCLADLKAAIAKADTGEYKSIEEMIEELKEKGKC